MSLTPSRFPNNKIPFGILALICGATGGTYIAEIEKVLEIYYEIFGEDGLNFSFAITAGIIFVWWDTRKNLQITRDVLNEKVMGITEDVKILQAENRGRRG